MYRYDMGLFNKRFFVPCFSSLGSRYKETKWELVEADYSEAVSRWEKGKLGPSELMEWS